MMPLFRILRLIWQEERAALWRGLLLSVAVLVAGAMLLGLSGWFITASGAAGLAGIGIAFDVFRPSAGVRMLALGRTAARYGERLLTHDATLRALARLRVRLLDSLARQDAAALSRLRSPTMLNRVISDVDALDGVVIRLVFPLLAAGVTLALAGALLAWLVTPGIAALTVGVLSAGGAATMLLLGRASIGPAAEAEAGRQSLREVSIEHLRGRTMLTFDGALGRSRAAVLTIDEGARAAARRLARLDARAGALVSATGIVAAATALFAGGLLALGGTISPAVAAIAVFATLALTEALAPLQRAVAEVGRMRDAAARVAPMLDRPPAECPVASASPPSAVAPLLRLRGVGVAAPGGDRPILPHVDLDAHAGETVGIIGRSGCGKSSLLSVVAGLAKPLCGQIELSGIPLAAYAEHDLRRRLGFLPQRSQLMSGTIRFNLSLAAPAATEAEMDAILDTLDLGSALADRGGLDMLLGESGSGLSGGEARRLALARVLLRRPDILLLDEPTEGLDDATARKILPAIRAAIPGALIILATHKPAEIAACDKLLSL